MYRRYKVVTTIKLLLISAVFIIAVFIERPSQGRLTFILTIFITLLLWNIYRSLLLKESLRQSIYPYIVDLVLIFLLEYNSRFVVNYFFHSFYLVVIAETGLILKGRQTIKFGAILALVSMYKFISLYSYNNFLSSVSQFLFNFLTIAFIISLTSYSRLQREEREKQDILYNELMETHKKLKEFSNKVEELSALEERNRIARDIHDSLGHVMTGIIMELEMSLHKIDEDLSKSKLLIEQAKENAKKGLAEIRRAVKALKPDLTSGSSLIDGLFKEFEENTGITVTKDGLPLVNTLSPTALIVLYNILKESMTNSAKHGNSTCINILFERHQKNLDFTITDNGSGCIEICKGFGLAGIEERILSINGKVAFISTEMGFEVRGYIPLEVSSDD